MISILLLRCISLLIYYLFFFVRYIEYPRDTQPLHFARPPLRRCLQKVAVWNSAMTNTRLMKTCIGVITVVFATAF